MKCPICSSDDIAMLVVNESDTRGTYECQSCSHKFIIMEEWADEVEGQEV
jgi:transcription elongation factor Elf1